MWVVFLFPLLFALMYRNVRKEDCTIYKIIVGLYFFSSVTACYLTFFSQEYSTHSMEWTAALYLMANLFVLIYPAQKLDRFRNEPLSESNDSIIQPFSIVIIILFLLYFFNQIRNISLTSIFSDAAAVRYSDHDFKIQSGTLFAYIEAIVTNISAVPLALAFYYMYKYPNRKLLIVLLLFCSLVNPLVSLRNASRVVFPKYILTVFFLYLLTRTSMDEGWQKSLKKFMIYVGAFVVIIFVVISMSRFSDGHYNNEGGTIMSFLAYFGQNFCNFSDYFTRFPDGYFPDQHGQLHFPVFAGDSMSQLRMNEAISTDIRLNTFTTVVGSWMCDVGIVWTAVISLFVGFIIRTVGRMRQYNVFTLIYIIMIYEFLYYSIFYAVLVVTKYYLYALAALIILDHISRIPQKEV